MLGIYLRLVGSMAIWGATWVAGRVVAAEMSPFPAAFLRFFFAAVFMVLYTMRAQGAFPLPTRRDLPWVALLGLTGVFLYNAFFFLGLQTVPAGRAAVIVACCPTVLALASRLFMGERLPLSRLIGIPISLTGVAWVISGGNLASLAAGAVGFGELCIVGCVLSWAAYSLVGKVAMARMTTLAAVMWSCLVGDALLLAAAVPSGLAEQAARASWTAWGCLAFLGVLATGIAFTWYYEGIKALGTSRAGIFINLVPVFAVALGAAILHEPVTWALLTGGLLVLTGVWWTSRPAATVAAPASATVSEPRPVE